MSLSVTLCVPAVCLKSVTPLSLAGEDGVRVRREGALSEPIALQNRLPASRAPDHDRRRERNGPSYAQAVHVELENSSRQVQFFASRDRRRHSAVDTAVKPCAIAAFSEATVEKSRLIYGGVWGLKCKASEYRFTELSIVLAKIFPRIVYWRPTPAVSLYGANIILLS
jgi:hypothetical protein